MLMGRAEFLKLCIMYLRDNLRHLPGEIAQPRLLLFPLMWDSASYVKLLGSTTVFADQRRFSERRVPKSLVEGYIALGSWSDTSQIC